MEKAANLYLASNKVITQAVLFEYYLAKYDKLYGHLTEAHCRLRDPFGRPIHRRHTKIDFGQFMASIMLYANQRPIRFDLIEYDIELQLGMHKTEE
jgi:hypothetical protein